jgi:hypothetical protein
MYYKCSTCALVDGPSGPQVEIAAPLRIALAESEDGIHWQRPNLGLLSYQGSTANNLVWAGAQPRARGVHGFAPLVDTHRAVSPESRYKAVGAERKATGSGLYAMQSPDGVHWRLMQGTPVIQEGAFDSQNLAFWDAVRGEYRAYLRDFHATPSGERRRGIRTATSADFVHWTQPKWLSYPGAPDEQLYTNQILPHPRAPHIFVGFPTRYTERSWSPTIEALPELAHRRARARTNERYGTVLTDGLFMSSRDGRTFHRWPEAFLRPGPRDRGNWAYGDNYQCWGLLETQSDLPGAPPELSLYATENYWRGTHTVFRRHTLRLDGFVSISASMNGGELLTRPLRYTGRELRLNMATSAAGSIRVEIQTTEGTSLKGYELDRCYHLVGDETERIVAWEQGADVSVLQGRPVRLRFVLKDADLYALRFANENQIDGEKTCQGFE